MYDPFGRVVKENTIDNNKLSEHCFKYDINGRLIEETKSVDNMANYLIKHDSLMKETITAEYYVQSGEKRDTANIIAKRFDTQGHLIFEETVMYLNEGIIGMPSKPFSTAVRYWMYEKGRIVKYMYRKSEDEPINLSSIILKSSHLS
jgi:YD repeat-containing protein